MVDRGGCDPMLSALVPPTCPRPRAVAGMSAAADLPVTELPVERLHVDDLNPREDPGDLDALAASIQQEGIHTPLVVRVQSDGRWGVLSGSRRLAAARKVGLTAVPCLVRKGLSDDEAAVLAVTENTGRQQLNPVEEARAYRRLVRDHRLTQTEVARRCGVSHTTVNIRLQLLDELSGKELKRLASGQLTVSDAYTGIRKRRRERDGHGREQPRVGRWGLPAEPPESNGEHAPAPADSAERRQRAVAELLYSHTISRAEDLIPLLAERGIAASKAQLNRDLKVLGARKTALPPAERHTGSNGKPATVPDDQTGGGAAARGRYETTHQRARKRQAMIARLVRERDVSSLDELLGLLRERGVQVSKSGVGRDLQAIGAERVAGEGGEFYRVPCERCGDVRCAGGCGTQGAASPDAPAPVIPISRSNGQGRGQRVVEVSLPPDHTLAKVPPGKTAVLLDAADVELVEGAARLHGITPSRWLSNAIRKQHATELPKPRVASG